MPQPHRESLLTAIRKWQQSGRPATGEERLLAAFAVAAAGNVSRAVELLAREVERRPADADLRSDLAGMRLLSSKRDPWQIVVALEDIDRALEIAPRSAAARHNRALVLEEAGLYRQALRTWREGDLPPTDPWRPLAAQRQRRLESLLAEAPSSANPPPLGDLRAWEAEAFRDPGGSIEDAAERLVPELRRCVAEAGCGPRQVMRGLVSTLKPKTPDRLLVDLLEQPHDGTAWRLWRTHRDIATWYEDDELERIASALPMLRRYDLSAYPWLRGEVDGFDALISGMDGRLGDALVRYQAAAESYRKAQASYRQGWAERLAAQTIGELGLEEAAWQRVRPDLADSKNVQARGRHMVLGKTAQFLAARYPRAADEFWEEALAGDDASGDAVVTLLLRSQCALDHLRTTGVERDLLRARKAMAAIRSGEYRAILERWSRLEELRLAGLRRPGSTVLQLQGLAEEAPIADLSEARILGELAFQLESAGRLREAKDAYLTALARARRESVVAGTPISATPLEERRLLDRAVRLIAIQLRDPAAALAAVEAQRSSERSGAAPSWEAVAERLPPHAAVVAYWSLPETLVIWVLRHHAPLRMRLVQIGRASLAQAARAMSAATEEDLNRRRTSSHWLHACLVAPLRSAIAGASDLVIVRDAALVGVPLAALLDPASGRYWVEDVRLQYTPALLGLLPAAKRVHPDSFLGVADPAGAGPPLPGARVEVTAAGGHYRQTAYLIGAAASEGGVADALARGVAILHVAAHAEVFPRFPSQSWIELSPDAGSDGRWTVAEIRRLRVPGAKLAVLASCRSGLDPGRSLEDGSALVEAFFTAGFSQVLVAKTAISDRSASVLLTGFHEVYGSTGEAAGALRTAQLAALRRGESVREWSAYEVMTVQVP